MQRHEVASQEGCNEIPPLFGVSQQYSNHFVFRADTLCCWSDGPFLSQFLLRNHCREGTFIRIDFCVFSRSLQRFGVTKLVLSCCQSSFESFSKTVVVAWLKSFGSVVLTASLLHAHLIAAWTPRHASSSPRLSRNSENVMATAEHMQEAPQQLQAQESCIVALETQLRFESARAQTAEQERSEQTVGAAWSIRMSVHYCGQRHLTRDFLRTLWPCAHIFVAQGVAVGV